MWHHPEEAACILFSFPWGRMPRKHTTHNFLQWSKQQTRTELTGSPGKWSQGTGETKLNDGSIKTDIWNWTWQTELDQATHTHAQHRVLAIVMLTLRTVSRHTDTHRLRTPCNSCWTLAIAGNHHLTHATNLFDSFTFSAVTDKIYELACTVQQSFVMWSALHTAVHTLNWGSH